MTAAARLVAVDMRWCDIAGTYPSGPGWQIRLVIARPGGQVMRGWRLRRWADGGGWRLYRYDLEGLLGLRLGWRGDPGAMPSPRGTAARTKLGVTRGRA
ncbi:MAG: hypothetical protein OXF41_08775 [bacterium]|nr:hypothetical protein [bacterium]